jgi:hypothetical protein
MGWSGTGLLGWTLSYPDSGGNPTGYLQITSPDDSLATGEVCASQTFMCGSVADSAKGSCRITLTYKLLKMSGVSYGGHVRIYVDNDLQHTSPPSDSLDWQTLSVTVPCGEHTLRLCLSVDAIAPGAWQACFDNVAAQCQMVSPVEPSTWGRIKSIYRK